MDWLRAALGWLVPALRKTADCADELADQAEWTRAILPEDDPACEVTHSAPVAK